jgi:hypothetical protein
LASTGRLGWFLIGVILGAIVKVIYAAIIGIMGSIPPWFGGMAAVVVFLIRLVAWFGLMLAVVGSLGSRIIKQDQTNYVLIGFGAIIITLELFSFIQFHYS